MHVCMYVLEKNMDKKKSHILTKAMISGFEVVN